MTEYRARLVDAQECTRRTESWLAMAKIAPTDSPREFAIRGAILNAKRAWHLITTLHNTAV